MNRKIHIVHVSEVLATGILTFIHTLVTKLPEFKHSVIFKIRDLGYDEEDVRLLFPDNVDLISWTNIDRSLNPIKDYRAAKELLELLKEVKPDILHLHSSKAGAIGRIIGPKIISKNKIIYTPNGAPFARKDISPFTRLIFKILEKTCDIISGKVICVSKTEFKTYEKIGIKPLLIYNGVSMQTANNEKYSTTKNDQITIVNVGRIVIQKNPRRFNEIAKHFEPESNIKFIWIGNGPSRKLLTATNITVTGWISKAQVSDLLNKSSIYLSTSDWEGLSFSSLEAMAHKLPTIMSDCVGNIDLVKHEETGFLYQEVEQAISYLNRLISEGEDYRKTLAENAYNFCQANFSQTLMLDQHRKLYFNLTSG